MVIPLTILVDSVKVEPPLVVSVEFLGGLGAEAVGLLGHAIIVGHWALSFKGNLGKVGVLSLAVARVYVGRGAPAKMAGA